MVVCSFDAHRGGVGEVARSRYAYLSAWSKPYNDLTDPLVAEALALRDDVIIAKLRGYPKVVMETDCLEIVNLWNTRHGSRAVVVSIIQEIGELVLSFSSISIQHVMRFFPKDPSNAGIH
jgi:hypothetical protein